MFNYAYIYSINRTCWGMGGGGGGGEKIQKKKTKKSKKKKITANKIKILK